MAEQQLAPAPNGQLLWWSSWPSSDPRRVHAVLQHEQQLLPPAASAQAAGGILSGKAHAEAGRVCGRFLSGEGDLNGTDASPRFLEPPNWNHQSKSFVLAHRPAEPRRRCARWSNSFCSSGPLKESFRDPPGLCILVRGGGGEGGGRGSHRLPVPTLRAEAAAARAAERRDLGGVRRRP